MSANKVQTEERYQPVRGLAALGRLAIIGGVMAALAGGFAYAGGWLTPGRLSPDEVADALEASNGHHPGFRRNHAKGVCIGGWFDGNGAGTALSTASVFVKGRVPIIGRLALASGRPDIPDSASPVWSMALRFVLPGGEEWRTGMNNIPVFPVRNAEEFRGLVDATRPDPATGKPDPSRVKPFLADHPATAAALAKIQAAPKAATFETAAYNSLNAFRFNGPDGKVTAVRWSMVPEQKDGTTGNPSAPNSLFDDLIAAQERQVLRWHLVVTLAGPADVTADPTVAWPDDRTKIDLGTLTIDRVEGEATGGCRDVNFDPLVLPAGIEPSDDPILSARSAVYSASVRRRDGEAKTPSAVQTVAVRPGESK